eukprot:scaffold60627_cov37-Tisochrysis_lutea.AAC.2
MTIRGRTLHQLYALRSVPPIGLDCRPMQRPFLLERFDTGYFCALRNLLTVIRALFYFPFLCSESPAIRSARQVAAMLCDPARASCYKTRMPRCILRFVFCRARPAAPPPFLFVLCERYGYGPAPAPTLWRGDRASATPRFGADSLHYAHAPCALMCNLRR